MKTIDEQLEEALARITQLESDATASTSLLTESGHQHERFRQEIAALTAKGFAGTVFLTTDDCLKAYEELSARGVEFTERPTEQPYGIDCGFRDPSGNSVRLAQRSPTG